MKKVKSSIKWYGGKFYLAPKIVKHIPPDHDQWLDGCCGSMAVTLAKPAENVIERVVDTNQTLMNFWKVMADEKLFVKFRRKAEATPFSEPLFNEAVVRVKNTRLKDLGNVGAALDFFVVAKMSRQALLRDYATPTTRLRRGMNEHVSAWLTAVDGLQEVHDRVRRIEIICGATDKAIRKHATKSMIAYIDPPYLAQTRVTKKDYGEHEMSDRAHAILLATLCESTRSAIKRNEYLALPGNEGIAEYADAVHYSYPGRFILSGYKSPLYEEFAAKEGWHCVEMEIPNNASSKKTKDIKVECLWMNFKPKSDD